MATVVPVVLHVDVVRPDSVLDLHLAPSRFLETITGGWTPSEDLGRRTAGNIGYLPVGLAFAGLRATGLSALATERMWFCLVLLGIAFGMRRLYRSLWDDTSTIRSTAAALLYTFNPFVLLNLGSATVLLLTYAALPWITAELVLLARTRRLRHAVALTLLGSTAATGVNVAQNAILWLGCVLVVAAVLMRLRSRAALLMVLGAFGWVAATSLWWLGPFLASLRAGGAEAVLQTDPIEIGASQSSFREVLRLTGLWSLYFANNGEPFVRSHYYLLSPPIVAVTLLQPVGAAMALRRLWPDVRARCILAVAVLAVPLAVSVHPPQRPAATGVAYRWLHDNVFAFRAFRSNYKWVALLAFAYALLLPTLLEGRRRPERSRIANAGVSVLVAAVAAVGAFPFFADLTYSRGYELGTVPGYWREATAWLDRQPGDGRVLFTPGQPFAAYEWGRPSGDIAPLLLRRPVITPRLTSASNEAGRELVKLVDEAVTDPDIPFDKLLAILRVSHLVQRNDLDVGLYGSTPPSEMAAFLQRQPALRLVRTFGRLDVYEVDQDGRLPLLGAARGVDLLSAEGGVVEGLRRYRPGTLARFQEPRIVNPVTGRPRSSSVWMGLDGEYGASRAFDGDPSTAWVSGRPGGRGEWIETTFKAPQTITDVIVRARRNGVDSVPTRLVVQAGGAVRHVGVDGAGEGRTHLGVAASSLRVTILDAGGGAGTNVGLTEVQIAGVPADALAFPEPQRQERGVFRLDFDSPVTSPHLEREVEVRTPSWVAGTAIVDPRTPESELRQFLRLRGVRDVRSSSRWRDLAAYSALRAFDGDPGTAWVGERAGGGGEWIEVDFDGRRGLPEVWLRGRDNGVDAEVTAVEVSVDGEPGVRRDVAFGTDGVAVLPVGRTAERLRITLIAASTGRPSHNVGISEFGIPGVVAERHPEILVPAALVNGDVVALDTVGDVPPDAVVFDGVPVAVQGDLALPRGRARFRPAGGLLRLRSLDMRESQESATVVPLQARRPDPGTVVAPDVPLGAEYLFFSETADPFWTATVGGAPLQALGTANGYGMVWAIDGRSGPVRLHFDEGGAHAWAVASALSALLGGGLLALVWARRRRGPRCIPS